MAVAVKTTAHLVITRQRVVLRGLVSAVLRAGALVLAAAREEVVAFVAAPVLTAAGDVVAAIGVTGQLLLRALSSAARALPVMV